MSKDFQRVTAIKEEFRQVRDRDGEAQALHLLAEALEREERAHEELKEAIRKGAGMLNSILMSV